MSRSKERLELKYLIRSDLRGRLVNLWQKHLQPAEHTNVDGSYPVLSQYYDSPRLHFYHDKYAGVPIRRKLRIRTYWPSFSKGANFIEIKHRRGQRMWKSRKCLSGDIETFLKDPAKAGGIYAALAQQYSLQRTAQVFYVRHAYVATDSVVGNLRLTFDSSIICLPPSTKMGEESLYSRKNLLLPEHFSIFEIKADKALPEWIFRTIKKEGLLCRPLSKYVLAVDKMSPLLLQLGDS